MPPAMPVVIVAAGVASRLYPYSRERPKTLMELEPERPLILFVLERLRRAGLGPIYVVTRREFAGKLAGRLSGEARVLIVDREEFGNLYTVYTAMKHVKPPFLIAMSDHIFEYELLERLLSYESDRAFTICLDREPPALDAWEGLKVQIEGGRVVAVGKGLESRCGIDTGLIVVREGGAAYIEKVIRERGPHAAIGDALDLAANRNDIDFVDVTGLLWKDVDTPEDLLEARRLYSLIALRELEKASAEPATKLVVRPLSRRLALRVAPGARGEAAARLALAELALAALVVALLAADALWLPALLALSYAALLLADVRKLLVRLCGEEGALGVLSTSSAIVYEAALLAGLAGRWPRGPLIDALTLLALASAATAETARSYALSGGSVAVLADRTLRVLSVGLLLHAPLWPLSLSLWLLSGAGAVLGLRTRASRRPQARRTAVPHLERRATMVEWYVELAVINGLKLTVVLVVLWLTRSALSGLSLSLDRVTVTSDAVISCCWLVAIIYYGYRILAGVRGVVDALSLKLASLLRITESSARSISMNALYLAVSVLVSIFVPPALRGLPAVGELLSAAISVVMLALSMLLLYTLIKELRRTLKGFVRLLVARVAAVVEGGG